MMVVGRNDGRRGRRKEEKREMLGIYFPLVVRVLEGKAHCGCGSAGRCPVGKSDCPNSSTFRYTIVLRLHVSSVARHSNNNRSFNSYFPVKIQIVKYHVFPTRPPKDTQVCSRLYTSKMSWPGIQAAFAKRS
jgi:hypothetical protein